MENWSVNKMDFQKVEKLAGRLVLQTVRSLAVEKVPVMVGWMVVLLDASVVDYWDEQTAAELVVH
jgi:hypothetical protein